jgi:hypothetical protein
VRLASGQELSCGALAGDVDVFAGLQEAGEAHGGGSSSFPSGGAAPDAAAGADADSGASAPAAGSYVVPGSGGAVARAVAITDAAPLQQVAVRLGSGSSGLGGWKMTLRPVPVICHC